MAAAARSSEATCTKLALRPLYTYSVPVRVRPSENDEPISRFTSIGRPCAFPLATRCIQSAGWPVRLLANSTPLPSHAHAINTLRLGSRTISDSLLASIAMT
jgi:hypothetical protein